MLVLGEMEGSVSELRMRRQLEHASELKYLKSLLDESGTIGVE